MQLPSRLPVPVKGVDRDELKDTWGAARSQSSSHEGIDILAPRGTKVYSATEGLIADLRNNNLGGKVIWILGPAGTWHYYAHLDGHKRGLNVGDYVKKGRPHWLCRQHGQCTLYFTSSSLWSLLRW